MPQADRIPAVVAKVEPSLYERSPSGSGEQPGMAWMVRTLSRLIAATAIALVPAGSVSATGRLDVVAKFQQPSLELDVATYIDPAIEAPTGKVGLLGLASGSVRNSFALHGEEWGALTVLWAKATRMQSRNWRTVGTLTEKGSGDVSRLTILAGLGVRIVVTSAKGAGLTYVIAKADMPRFGAAINQVKEMLASSPPTQ
jgi:hypothetical protein